MISSGADAELIGKGFREISGVMGIRGVWIICVQILVKTLNHAPKVLCILLYISKTYSYRYFLFTVVWKSVPKLLSVYSKP